MLLVFQAIFAVAASGAATTALAAESGGGHSPSEAVFICQIVALLIVGRALSEVAQRVGQPAVMGQLLAGIVLGPSVLGAIWPEGQQMLFPDNASQKAMLEGVSQLGILLLLLITGMETDLALVKRIGRAAFSVSLTGVAVPFACGFALGEFLPASLLPHPEQRLMTSLFLGTALSISSVKIVAMVVREMDFLRRNVGQIIVASAIIDDTIGWVIIAVTFSLAAHGTIDFAAVGKTVLGTAPFLAASFTVGRRLVFLLIRWANDELHSEAALVTTILVVMGLMALATQAIGVHTVLGAFVAGILVGQSPILTRQIDEQLRSLIAGLFAPVFFGLAGLHRRSHDPAQPVAAAADGGADRDRQRRKVPRGLHRRHDRRTAPGGIACARLRHERARIDGGHRRDDRPVDGRAEQRSLHDDRRDGRPHHARHAAESAMGARAAADRRRREETAGPRGIRVRVDS